MSGAPNVLPEFAGSGTVSIGPVSTLGNISTRAFVQTGDNVVIGGFIVQGTEPKTVIIRAIGPELTQYGVPNVLANPTLELHNGAGALLASNNNWITTVNWRHYQQRSSGRHPEQRPRSKGLEGVGDDYGATSR